MSANTALKQGSTVYYWIWNKDVDRRHHWKKSIKDALEDLENEVDTFALAVNAESYVIAKAMLARDYDQEYYSLCPVIKRTFPLYQAYKIIGKA